MADCAGCVGNVCTEASIACSGNTNCVQVGPGTGCSFCDTNPNTPGASICGSNALYNDCSNGCALMAAAAQCGATCIMSAAGCEACAIGNCFGLCTSCSDKCDYGCRDATHQPAYTELGTIADKILSVDGVALINLITEEMDRRGKSVTAMAGAAVGTKVMNSTMTAARTNLSAMNKTVDATSTNTQATKTLFQDYVTAARQLYETQLLR